MAEEEIPPEFRSAIAELLFQSQSIEWLLRVILSDINEAADDWVRTRAFRFKTRVDDLTNVPLGNLVKLYAFHSETDWLVKRLRQFVKVRNYMAHVAFIWVSINKERLEDITSALRKTNENIVEAKRLVEALTKESMRTYELKTGRPISAAPVDIRP